MDCMLELVEIKNDMIRDQLDVIKNQTEEILELKKQVNKLIFLVKRAKLKEHQDQFYTYQAACIKDLEYLS